MVALQPGMLVEIAGPIAGSDTERRAQLQEFKKDTRTWDVVTFDAREITIEETFIRHLKAEDLRGIDFVLGPKSDGDIIGQELTLVLASKGYAVLRLMVATEDTAEILAAAKQVEEAGMFSRFPPEFERGYLGVGCTGKVAQLDPSADDTPTFVKNSTLAVVDDNFTSASSMLRPHAEANLGFGIYSRTDLLLRLPLGAEDVDRYPPAEIRPGEAESHLHLMHRRRLTAIQFVGPNRGTLRLVPRRPGATEVTMPAEPSTIVFVLDSHFEYSYASEGDSLAMQTFYLSEPVSYTLDRVDGDVGLLGMLGRGPPPPPGEQISVDGMYCRYGTGADGRSQFWVGVGQACTDGVTEIPINRWDNDQYYDPESKHGGYYTKHACFGVEGVELFDCRFFEISPAEARGMDPVQRQVMEVSYLALLEGGWDKRTLQREPQNIGHFVGIDKDDWMCMAAGGAIDLSGAHGAAAGANSITSNRFSYSMNLKGASMTIDTACSSSLVCTHVAKMHLRFKDHDPMPAAIVNGINLMLYPGPFIGCCAANMLSHAGRCFTFDASADGYTRGELCGALCFNFKQHDESSFACLAGSQANQDGRSASLTAPNGPAQERCIRTVLREAGLTPAEVDCFECHGTGTALGDPIEVGSFKKVMSATAREDPLVITSSKSNIGHGEGGAGLAGLFKSCLQVAHCEGISNVHLKELNPHLDLGGFPCLVLSESIVLREDSAYTGVSSFGFGGTNAHAEAWGKNVMTSRGAGDRDLLGAFQRRLKQAPPADVITNGDDILDWETNGMNPTAKVGSAFKVQLDEAGNVTWEADDDGDETFDEYGLRGTYRAWQPLEAHETIEGLWVGTIVIGGSGEEDFQIVGGTDETLIFHPNKPRCTFKATPICGPEPASKDMAWLVRGSPGERFKIEFFHRGAARSILWMRAASLATN